MYRTPVAALIGELLGKNLWSLIATSLIAPAGWLAAKTYLFAAPGASALGNPIGYVFMMVLALQLAAIFAYVDLTAGSKSAGFPQHLLLLPVPTWLLALLPIVAGSVFISGFVLLWLRYVSGVEFGWAEQLTIAAAIVSLMCWVQAMSWELLPPRWLRIVVLTVVVIAAILSVISFLAKEPDFLFGRTGGAIGLSATALGGFGLAYVAVIRSRRGDSLHLGAIIKRSLVSLGLFSAKARLPSLSDAVGAQDWFEWKVYGKLLPLFMTIVAAGPLALAAFSGQRQAPSFILPGMMLFVFFVMSPLMGAAYITKNLTRRVQIGSFSVTRPLSDVEIAFAKLRLAVRSHLLSLAIVLVAAIATVLRSNNNVILSALWARLAAQQGLVGSCLSVFLLLVVGTAASLASTAYFMSLQLFNESVDKKKHRWIISLGVTALFFLALTLGRRIYESRATELARLESVHYEPLIPALVLSALGLCLLLRLRHSHSLGALKGLTTAFGVGAAVCLLGVWQLHLSLGYRWALSWLVATVALLTFIPFLLMPLLVGRNRHR